MKRLTLFVLLSFAVSSCGSDPDEQPPLPADVTSEFEFGPVEGATVPVGLDRFDDGTEVLAARVDSETVVLSRSGPDVAWSEFARVAERSHDFEIVGDELLMIVRRGVDQGSQELVLRSVDRGQSWDEIDFGAAVGQTGADLLETQSGVLVVQAGEVSASSDGGATWTRKSTLPSATAQPLERFVAGADGLVYARLRGASQVLKSSDGGGTWTAAEAGAESPRGFSVLEQPGGGNLYVHGAADAVVWTSTDGTTWQSETVDVLPDYFLSFEAFFFHDATLHALLGNEEATVITRRTATGWELVYEGYQGASGLFAVDWSSRDGVLTVVQNDLGHTVRQATIAGGTATETALRFQKSVAAIRGGAVVPSGREQIAFWAVESAPGREGGMDEPLGAADRVDLEILASADGENWTPRGTVPSVLPFEIDGGVAAGDGRIVVVVPVGGLEVVVSTSDDGGATFTERHRIEGDRNLHVPTGVWHLGGDEWLFQIGFSTLHHSDDGGDTWTQLPDSGYFVAAGGGRLIGLTDGAVFESNDSGATWSQASDTFGAEFDAEPQSLQRSFPFPSRLRWAGDSFWLLNHIDGDGQVVRGRDGEWAAVDDVDDFRPMEVIAGSEAVYVYGNAYTSSDDGELSTSAVARYASDGASFTDRELALPASLGTETRFVDVARSGDSHVVLLTSGDGGVGAISRISAAR